MRGRLLREVGELDPDLLLHVIAGRLRGRIEDEALRAKVRWRPSSRWRRGFRQSRSVCRIFCGRRVSVRAARITRRPWCPRGRSRVRGSGATSWRPSMPERHTISRPARWAARGLPGSARRRSPKPTHIFQNLGDGTYFHSGLLAIRAAIAAKMNITYKILLNGAIAMTGGQTVEGESFESKLTGPHIANQLAAEGCKRIALVSDDPSRHDRSRSIRTFVTFHPRDELDSVQRELRDICRRHQHHLRAGLRDRAPPPAQARQAARPGGTPVHPSRGVRGLRRLWRAIELHCRRTAGNTARPQAPHQPDGVQQGFFLRERPVPELHHRARRQAARPCGNRGGRSAGRRRMR